MANQGPGISITAENAAVLFIDNQTGLISCTETQDHKALMNNTIALGKLAKIFKLPVVLTTSYSVGPNGPLHPDLVAQFPGQPIIDRSIVNAWDDPRFTTAVKATGRKKLIISGISTEVCVAFPAIMAVREGFDVYACIDTCATWTHQVEQGAFLRMSQAGVVLTNWVSLSAELLRDWQTPAGGPVGGVFAEHFDRYNLLLQKSA